MRIPDTLSPLRCKVTTGLEQVPGDRDESAGAAVNPSPPGVAGAWARTLKLKDEKAGSPDETPGRARGTNWSEMAVELAIMLWLI